MALSVGTRFGAYEVIAKIGEGGMGEVYRASDTNLGRQVALKTLPDTFIHDPERLKRFEREAKTLASLNHPNIAQIYGLERADDIRALVMELVEGPTLADRIAQGPIPVDEALPIAKQIAEALEAAHEQNIVHRDLKPANIKLRSDGVVKVLDFGLAKALEPMSMADMDATAPTITSPAMTRVGMLLGTAAYMSPEQARGKPIDKRTDIWAFGCVLFEMLTATRAFAGDEVTDVLACILERDVSFGALPPDTPAAVHRLLRRSLRKDRRERLADIADARLDVVEAVAAAAGNGMAVPGVPFPRTRHLIPATLGLLAGVAATVIASWVFVPPAPAPKLVSRLVVSLSSNDRFSAPGRNIVALAPDGRHLAYVANQRLYVRALDQLEAKLIPGTEVGGAVGHARSPFFSPDGQWVGFWQTGELKKVSVNSGPPVAICAAASPFGASWAPDNTIVFGGAGVWRVSAAGGTPELLVKLEPGQAAHAPQMLPGENAILFTLAASNRWDDAEIVHQSVETNARHVIVRGGRDARYISAGYLVYARRGTLLAVPFDAHRGQTTGEALPIAEGVGDAGATAGLAHFGVSNDGSLVYVPGADNVERTVVWVDRQGREQPTNIPPGAYMYPRLSPDGQRVALSAEGTNTDLWVYESRRATLTRLTFESNNTRSVWTPDGSRIAFSSNRAGVNANVYWLPADGSVAAERLTTSDFQQVPEGWAPDGKTLLFSEYRPDTNWDIWTLSIDDRRSQLFLRTPFHDGGRAFSPDGRWLAYYSDESGRGEVQVRPFPGPGPKWQVSTDGGAEPVWARSGREMFYRSGNRLMVVDVQLTPTFTAGTPRVLFEGAYETSLPANFDVSPDGRRFIMIKRAAAADNAARLVFVQNLFEELKRVVPAN